MAEENKSRTIWILLAIAVVAYLMWAYNKTCCIDGLSDCIQCDPITGFINKTLRSIFKKQESTSSSDYQKCVDANKSLPEGSDCTTCVGSGESLVGPLKGKIVNGVCVPSSDTQPGGQAVINQPVKGQIQVSNSKGTPIYNIDSANFEMNATNQIMPSGAKIGYVDVVSYPYCDPVTQYCYAPVNFYKMTKNQGYILSKDVTLV